MTLPRGCQSPEIQAFVAWAQEHPAALAEAIVAYQNEQIQQLGIAEAEELLADNEWETSPLLVERLETEPPTLTFLINIPALLIGLNQRYDYPELGLTVFTACALIWDNDLAQRVSSWAEATALPANSLGLSPLIREDPDQAEPQWYLGEVGIAYVLHPDSPLIPPEPVVGERKIYAWTVVTLHMSGGDIVSQDSTPKHMTTPYEVYVEPGCYYPYNPAGVAFQAIQKASPEQRERLWDLSAPLEDPYCERLEDILALYNQWVGEAVLTVSSRWGEVQTLSPWLTLAYQDEMNYDLSFNEVAMDDPEAKQAALRGWVDAFFADTWGADPQKELALMDDPTVLSFEATLFALPYVLETWKAIRAGGPQACSPSRALAQYKLEADSLSPRCPLAEVAQQDFWAPNGVVVFDGDIWSGGLRIPIESLLALQEQP